MGVCDIPPVSTVCDSAGEAAASLVAAPFDGLAAGMGNAAQWMFETVWQVFDSTTFVDVTSSEFTEVYGILFGIAIFVMLGFFLLQVIGGMIRREPAALSRAALGLAKSILGSFVALTLLSAALEITDQLCVGIVHAAGTDMEQMGDRIALLAAGIAGINVAAPGAGAIITIFITGLAIAAALLVWISLLVRKALLLIAIVFAPIALAGASWDHTRTWVSKWAAFVLALIVSKLVIVVIFLLATAQVSAPIDADLQSISEPIAGIVLMLVAGFAPYMAYKAISFMGFDIHHAMSAEQEAKGALSHPVHLPRGARSLVAGAQTPKVLHGEGGSGTSNPGSAGGASPARQGGISGPMGPGGGAGGGQGGALPAAGPGLVASGAQSAVAAGPRAGGALGAAVQGPAKAANVGDGPLLPTPQPTDPILTPKAAE